MAPRQLRANNTILQDRISNAYREHVLYGRTEEMQYLFTPTHYTPAVEQSKDGGVIITLRQTNTGSPNATSGLGFKSNPKPTNNQWQQSSMVMEEFHAKLPLGLVVYGFLRSMDDRSLQSQTDGVEEVENKVLNAMRIVETYVEAEFVKHFRLLPDK